ncbi:MAG: SH3 domain-containing protein [Cytophagales bacterium]|nr:SH3 domain-containing protein [Cytophagales bacterium]
MLRFILLTSFTCFAIVLQAQFGQYGIIYPEKSSKGNDCCVYFPKTGQLPLYDRPNGSKVGQLQRKGLDSSGNEDPYTLVFINLKNDTTELDFWGDLKEVGYEVMAISFHQYQDGYIKILPDQASIWASQEDLEKLGFRSLCYQEFMAEMSGKVLGFYIEHPLNLRSGPSASHEKLETLTFLHEISLTGVHQGQWSQVKVIKLNKERCEGEVIEEYELEGWIKVIDEEGNLNIWYYTRGC